MQITKGQRVPLADLISPLVPFTLALRTTAPALQLDFACFGLDANGKLLADSYMCFFNQPKTPCGAVLLQEQGNNGASFALDLARLPGTIERLVIIAASDGPDSMRMLQSGQLVLQNGSQTFATFNFLGSDFQDERALMLFELYRRDNAWRISATAQGFNGGMDALVRHFGAEVAAPEPVASTPAVAKPDQRVNLDKRIAAKAPQLVSLVKQAQQTLQKIGLDTHQAKVCLCLDISGSMRALYTKGLVQKLAERVLALACRFDDDGEIDVFLFGASVHQPEAMNIDNCPNYIKKIYKDYALEGDTRYGLAIAAIRKHYFGAANTQDSAPPITKAQVPVYVMFVTDGATSDTAFTEKQVRASSYEPIFWQFMGIGKGRKSKAKKFESFANSDFPLLEKLDDLPGRLIDNADFFTVLSPDEYPDEALFEMMMAEYPGWLGLAREKGLLPNE